MDDNKIPISTVATTSPDEGGQLHAPGDTFQPNAPAAPAAAEPVVSEPVTPSETAEVTTPEPTPVATAPEPEPLAPAAEPEPEPAPSPPPEPLHTPPAAPEPAKVVAHDKHNHPYKKRSLGKAILHEVIFIFILLVILSGIALAVIYIAKI